MKHRLPQRLVQQLSVSKLFSRFIEVYLILCVALFTAMLYLSIINGQIVDSSVIQVAGIVLTKFYWTDLELFNYGLSILQQHNAMGYGILMPEIIQQANHNLTLFHELLLNKI